MERKRGETEKQKRAMNEEKREVDVDRKRRKNNLCNSYILQYDPKI